jgi:hypothetical protein
MILLTLFVLCCRFLLSQFLMIHSVHSRLHLYSRLHLHNLFQSQKKRHASTAFIVGISNFFLLQMYVLFLIVLCCICSLLILKGVRQLQLPQCILVHHLKETKQL